MKFAKPLRRGITLAVLFGTVALVVWSMPDKRPGHTAAAPAADVSR